MAQESALFVVGDVCGCLYTFGQLLSSWDTAHERLVQVGDLIGAGAHSPETVALARRLTARYGDRTVFLRGDQEQSAIEYFEQQSNPDWLAHGGAAIIAAYARRGFSLALDVEWFGQRPLFWEDNATFISHAGIGNSDDPYNARRRDGVVWNRGPLEHIGKLQIIGHVPVDEPQYSPREHCWRINTTLRARKLSALRLDSNGNVLEVISIPVRSEDLAEQ